MKVILIFIKKQELNDKEEFMKTSPIPSIIVAGFLVFLLSFPVLAQQSAEELKGKEVQNEQGETLGTIEEVIIGPDGNIEAVVVKKGGFLGMGGEENRIPWNALRQGENQDSYVYSGAGAEQPQITEQQNQQETQQERPVAAQQDQEPGQERTAEQQDQKSEQQRDQVAARDSEADIRVEQPQAQVQVQQPEPQVRVAQPEPKVTVKQPPPEIEVQVVQPEPEVTVEQGQPKVDVRQQEPEVAVEQQEPKVYIQQEKPKVAIQQSDPEVQVEQSGRPEVYVEEQQQAQVQVQQQGEPQVDVAVQQPQEDQQAAGQQQREQPRAAGMDAAGAEQLVGRDLVSSDGERLGSIEDTKLSQDGNTVEFLIVQGDQNEMHPVPAELVQAEEGQQELTVKIDKQTFDSSPSFGPDEEQRLAEQQFSQEIESHYGIAPAWQQEQQGNQPQGRQQPDKQSPESQQLQMNQPGIDTEENPPRPETQQ